MGTDADERTDTICNENTNRRENWRHVVIGTLTEYGHAHCYETTQDERTDTRCYENTYRQENGFTL